MSSSTRNTRRANSYQRTLALGAGLALTVVSAAAPAGGEHQFVFTAYSDAAGGANLIDGRYRAALEELTGHPGKMDLDPSETNTNRCVAYSMTLQWPEARAACDAAVRAARDRRISQSAWWDWTSADSDDRLAVAYANRAVLHWLSNDGDAARQDMTRARELSPGADFVARNLAALELHGQVAQADAPSGRPR